MIPNRISGACAVLPSVAPVVPMVRATRCALIVNLCVFALLLSLPARAATPYVTDDAGLIAAGSCQVEAWVQRNRDSTEYWMLPACNLVGRLDLTFGASRTRADGASTLTDVQFEAKTAFAPMALDQWATALSAGTARHPVARSRDWYATLIASRAFFDERVLMHVNAGWLRDGEAGRHRATWGTAVEWRVGERTWLVGELFGQHRGRPYHQVGVRYALVPDTVEIDVTYGNRNACGSDDRWFTVGLRVMTPSIGGAP